jgi:hypothetical protein
MGFNSGLKGLIWRDYVIKLVNVFEAMKTCSCGDNFLL